MKRIAVISLGLAMVFCLVIGYAEAQNISDEARRHFDRGMAAVEMAKSPADYEPAIKEFEKAARLAPDWPDVYYNLGIVQEKSGEYRDAITSLRQYLRLAPNANDIAMVKSLINKLEYKTEKISKQEDILKILLEGTWSSRSRAVCSGMPPSMRFIKKDDSIYVNLPVMWDADRGQRMNFQNIPVEFDGSTIQFHYTGVFWAKAINLTSYCKLRWKIKVINSNILHATVYQQKNPPYELSYKRNK